jgi:hypothetical protein
MVGAPRARGSSNSQVYVSEPESAHSGQGPKTCEIEETKNVFTSCKTLLLALGIVGMLVVAAPSYAQIGFGVAVSIAPPELPVYDQPFCPGDDYIWNPGYWDWDADESDYFWVPGTWVLAPEPGFFWTPGYWEWRDTGYFWTAGYWGPVVGFYGGIDYGFGYFGHGFVGGRWEGGHFFYNRSVANVNGNIVRNTYEERVDERNVTRASFNGGRGGVEARPTSQEEAAARERHIGPIAAQTQHVQEARGNRELHASVNHGAPAIAATAKPTDFRTGVVRTREAGRVNPPPANARAGENQARGNEARTNETNNETRPQVPAHARDIQPGEKLPAPNTGNPKTDQKYQKQQEQLAAKQEQQRQKLQQQQEKDHQKAQKQQADAARQQQMEQKHQQQAQQLQQRQQQQRQQVQQRQAPRPAPAPRPEPGRPH